MSQTKAQLLEGTAAENVTVDNIVTTSVNGGQLSNRNRVINGAMIVNQRSSTYSATGEEYLLDRFNHRTGSSFNFDTTTTQDSSAPDGFTKSLKITPDSTQTPSGSHNGMIATLLEADTLIGFASGTSSAKKFVLSFYAKSASQNNNHQYSVQLSKKNSSGQFYYQNRSFTVTSSWQRFTVAFPADTSNNIITGNGEGLRILWHLAAGSDDIASAATSWTSSNGNHAVTGQSNFMDNTSNEFYLTGVQLEASDADVATDFEHISFAEELKKCQRYFYTSSRWMGGSRGSSTSRSFILNFGMRLTGNDVSSGTYTNSETSNGDVVYIGSSATRQESTVTANSFGVSSTSTAGSMQVGVVVGYGIGSGDNGIVTGLFINGFTIDHEL